MMRTSTTTADKSYRKLIKVRAALLLSLIVAALLLSACVKEIEFSSASFGANSESLSLTIQPHEFELLEGFTQLKTLDLSGSTCYEEIETFRKANPDISVYYKVNLGGHAIPFDATELDLASLGIESLEELSGVIGHFPFLKTVKLSSEIPYNISELKSLSIAANGAALDYSFDYYGRHITLLDSMLEYDKVYFGPEALGEIRNLISIMPNLEYLKLADAGISNEDMYALKTEFPNVKIVWRVYFGEYMHCLTDEETIRAIFKLNDKNCHDLKYCEDVKYMDIGHNSYLWNTEFIKHMPKLEILILSGSPFTDTSFLAHTPNLQFLEFVWCSYVSDISPIVNCKKLEYLNLSYNKVTDLSPLDELPLKRFMFLSSKIDKTKQEEFIAKHPDCWTNFYGENPYFVGWRYDDVNFTRCEIYQKVRDVFRYDENFYNNS